MRRRLKRIKDSKPLGPTDFIIQIQLEKPNMKLKEDGLYYFENSDEWAAYLDQLSPFINILQDVQHQPRESWSSSIQPMLDSITTNPPSFRTSHLLPIIGAFFKALAAAPYSPDQKENLDATATTISEKRHDFAELMVQLLK